MLLRKPRSLRGLSRAALILRVLFGSVPSAESVLCPFHSFRSYLGSSLLMPALALGSGDAETPYPFPPPQTMPFLPNQAECVRRVLPLLSQVEAASLPPQCI